MRTFYKKNSQHNALNFLDVEIELNDVGLTLVFGKNLPTNTGLLLIFMLFANNLKISLIHMFFLHQAKCICSTSKLHK